MSEEVLVPDRPGLLADLLADLRAESAALDAVLADLEDTAWLTPTPAEGWTVAMQVAHLAWTDAQALAALTDPQGFTARAEQARHRLDRIVDEEARAGASAAPAAALERWRTGRDALDRALAGHPAGTKVPWFGPPMSAASLATARLMETWAHGLDVHDALGGAPSISPRLRHVADLGVRTRDFAFRQRGLPPPAEAFHVELAAPDGSTWTWGPEGAAQRVSGPALDFCLRVTRRRHRADLDLRATGADADRWLDVAQAFAGPAGEDRAPAGGSTDGGS